MPFFSIVEVFLAQDSPSHLHAFGGQDGESTVLMDGAVEITVKATSSLFRSTKGPDGFSLSFSPFETADKAYSYARSYVLTLLARAASQETSLSVTLDRHEHVVPPNLLQAFEKSGQFTFQLMPGINVHPILPYQNRGYLKAEGVFECSFPSTPGSWVESLMDSAAHVEASEKLPLALSAFFAACNQKEPELRLLNAFAALECLAGTVRLGTETSALAGELLEKVGKSADFTDREKQMLKGALLPLTKASRRDAVMRMACEAQAPQGLVDSVGSAYGARGAYVHSAVKKTKISELALKMEQLFAYVVARQCRAPAHARHRADQHTL